MPCIYLTENLFNKQHGILPWRYIGSDQHDRNALYWTVIDPAGNTHNVCGLRFWVNTNRLNFNEVYYSKNSWKTTKHGTGKGGGRKKKGSVQL